MGLDMYLYARRYISNWGNEKELSEELNKVTESIRKGYNVQYITIEAMYWRKCNAIHAWFVKNVQNGIDDCGSYSVDDEKLRELLDTVNKVLEDHSKAEELLPSQSGFFFGSTEYGSWYFDDLERTKKELTELFEKFSDGEGNFDYNWNFEYQSSW